MKEDQISRRIFIKIAAAIPPLLSLRGLSQARCESLTSPLSHRGFEFIEEKKHGFFTLRYDERSVIYNGFAGYKTEDEEVFTYDRRFVLSISRSEESTTFCYVDQHRGCDILVETKRILGTEGICLSVTLRNTSSKPMRVKTIYPITSMSSYDGGLCFWENKSSVKILTDEWERCYGDAGVKEFKPNITIQSAWDIHLFDMQEGFNLSASFFEIPNAKIAFTLNQSEKSNKCDFIIDGDVRAGMRGVILSAGDSFRLHDLVFLMSQGSCLDALERYALLVAQRNNISPVKILPSGWLDWYLSYGKTSEEELLKQLDFISNELKDFGVEYFQVDSGWQAGIDLLQPPHNIVAGGPWEPNSRFPHGMKWLADRIRERGLKPGIWVRPLQVIEGGSQRKENPEWFNKNGQIDSSHTGVQDYLRGMFRMFTEDWGYEYIKYDFASFDTFDAWGPQLFGDAAAHVEPSNQSMTTISAYQHVVELMREAAGENVHLLACNSLMPSTLGCTDAFRVGDDVGEWRRTFHYGVKSIPARYYTNGIYWRNDPDCLLVREQFTVGQARMWASLIAISGGLVFISEDLTSLPAQRLAIIKNILPVYHNTTKSYQYGRPIDILENELPQVWHLPVAKSFGAWDIAAVFNWGESDCQKNIRFDMFGLNPEETYLVYDFWENRLLGMFSKSFTIMVPSQSCRVLSIRRLLTHPGLLSTNRHITQGGVEIEDIHWNDNSHVLHGISHVIKNNPYSIVINIPPTYRFVSIVGGEVEAENATLLRFQVESTRTSNVVWEIKFKKL